MTYYQLSVALAAQIEMVTMHTRGAEAPALEGSVLNARRAVVLAPHPDDEVLGCGGTILRLNSAGLFSTTVCVTDGERLHGDPSTAVAQARRAEARQAAGIMRSGDPLFLGLPDGGVSGLIPDLAEKLQGFVETQKPDLLFAPSPVDYHEDHVATARAALMVFRSLPTFTLAFYEVYGMPLFNCLVDITPVAEEKRALILSYRTSLYEKADIYARAALGLNAHRSFFVQTAGYYEALWLHKEPMTDQEISDWLTYGASRH